MKKTSILTLLPIMFSFFVMGFVDIVGTSVGYVKKDFNISDTLSNLLPMMVFLWFAVCSIPTGLLMRKIGRKNTVLISAVVTVLAMILPFISYSFPIMLCAFALLGIGNTILQVSLNPLLAGIVEPQKLTGTLTFGMFIKAIASASGPILIAFAATRLGDWKLVFAAFAVATVISFIWLVLVKVDEEKETGHQSTFLSVLALLKDRYILALFIVIVLIVGFEVGLMATVPKYFESNCGLTLEDGSYANTLYFIARTTATFIGAILLSRISIRKFSIVTLIIGIAGMTVFMLVSSHMILIISLFIVGLMCANVFPIAFSRAIQYKPEYKDEISSLMILGISGGALLPPLMGVLADLTNQRVSLTISVLSLILVFIIMLSVVKDK